MTLSNNDSIVCIIKYAKYMDIIDSKWNFTSLIEWNKTMLIKILGDHDFIYWNVFNLMINVGLLQLRWWKYGYILLIYEICPQNKHIEI